ncbi:hypothetical protein AeMF1_018079 [Aphanomyces euteiches]|nr:hypothetical protein AeMF1_018079 [Aphanomyces euteiches]KAH9190843.1 hypothetical protein AeNC1_007175 [Aphanomyces euteiches]
MSDDGGRKLRRLLLSLLAFFLVQFVVLAWYFDIKYEDIHAHIFSTKSPNNDQVFVRGVVLCFPATRFLVYMPQFRWLRRSWVEMQRYEPDKWRTDLILYMAPGTDLRPFQALGCTMTSRESPDEPNKCIVVPTYVSMSTLDFKYDFGDSINVAVVAKLDAYDYILRTDLDTFLTPAFATWRPAVMTVGQGGYEFQGYNTSAKLVRIAKSLNLTSAGLTNIGSTWYGPTKLLQTCANLTVSLMQYLHDNEFTPLEKSEEYGIQGWPNWHHGVLSLYAGHLAINHCTHGYGVEKRGDMLDVDTSSKGSTLVHAHLHAWQTMDRFSKLAFEQGAYYEENIDALDLNVIQDYAMFMALDSQRQALAPTPTPTLDASLINQTSFVRAAVVFIPRGVEGDLFLTQLRWFRRSWLHMHQSEPPLWRTDIVVVTDSTDHTVLTELDCTVENIRKTKEEPNRCVVVDTYKRLELGYRFGDSIGVVAQDIPALDIYDWLLRTDIDTFLTPAFATWKPSVMTVGKGAYSFSATNAARLTRIIGDMGFHNAGLTNLGSTWYGPASLVRACAKLTVQVMEYMREKEFTDEEKSEAYGTRGWPEWHYGVLSLYAGHVAINHCTKDSGVAKDEIMLDFPTASNDPTTKHAHLHTWQNQQRFSKFVFMSDGYKEVKENLDLDKVSDYAMFMALDSIATPPATTLPSTPTPTPSETIPPTTSPEPPIESMVPPSVTPDEAELSIADATSIPPSNSPPVVSTTDSSSTPPTSSVAPEVPQITPAVTEISTPPPTSITTTLAPTTSAPTPFIRAAVVFLPFEAREDYFVSQFRWFRRAWEEMTKYEPSTWRTDIVVMSNGVIKALDGLNCTATLRKSPEEPNRCITDPTYSLLRFDDFTYQFGDSINVVAIDSPVLQPYDWVVRTDIDTFLTPAFATWRPEKMTIGGGGYQTQSNFERLTRISNDLHLHATRLRNVGSTWYGPTAQVRECANLTVSLMKYLHEHEFTAEEKSKEYGTKGWPTWHYGVLTLYAGHIAIHNCTFESGVDKNTNMLDFPTTSADDVQNHAHLHTWQDRERFSKFEFAEGKYASENISALSLNKVSDYAMFMALDSQEKASP